MEGEEESAEVGEHQPEIAGRLRTWCYIRVNEQNGEIPCGMRGYKPIINAEDNQYKIFVLLLE